MAKGSRSSSYNADAESQCEVLEDLLQEEGYQTSCEPASQDYVLRVKSGRTYVATLRVTDDGIVVRTEGKPGTLLKVLEARGLGEYIQEKGPPEFDDEGDVLEQMSIELDIPENDLTIKSSHFESFGVAGTVWQVESGQKEWHVVQGEDEARSLAIAIVTQDLEHEPEIFNRDFLENHINVERLRRELHAGVFDMKIEDLTDEAKRHPEDFWDAYEAEGFEAPETNEEGERPEPTRSEIEELAGRQTDDRLEDPMGYLEDIYGPEDAMTHAMEMVGINVQEAAEAAIRDDGVSRWLQTYDGDRCDTPAGFVYWRTN